MLALPRNYQNMGLQIATTQTIPKALYDPSAPTKDGGYWQWANCKRDLTWEIAAEAVLQGWPNPQVSPEALTDEAGPYLGIISQTSEGYWFYRVYPGGQDFQKRLGRYFFLLFKLSSAEQLFSPEVSAFLDFFDKDRGLPLKTSGLDTLVLSGNPQAYLTPLYQELTSSKSNQHFGMDGHGNTRFFGASSIKPEPEPEAHSSPVSVMRPQPKSQRANTRAVLGASFLLCLGFGLGFWLGYNQGVTIGYSAGFDSSEALHKSKLSSTDQPTQPKNKELDERTHTSKEQGQKSPGKITDRQSIRQPSPGSGP